jgi:hypothetical protein
MSTKLTHCLTGHFSPLCSGKCTYGKVERTGNNKYGSTEEQKDIRTQIQMQALWKYLEGGNCTDEASRNSLNCTLPAK